MCPSTPGEYYDFPIRMYYVSRPLQWSVTFCQCAITQMLVLDPLGSRRQALNLDGDSNHSAQIMPYVPPPPAKHQNRMTWALSQDSHGKDDCPQGQIF